MTRERPRQVYLAFCERIARDVEALGFRYSPASQLLRRRRGDWTERLLFRTSVHNRSGKYVEFGVHATAHNRRLKAWRLDTASPHRQDDFVDAAELGSLAGRGWLDWDLVDPASRIGIAGEVLRLIADHALPWFELVEAGRSSEVAGSVLPIDAIVELVVFRSGPDEAAKVVTNWLEQTPAEERWELESLRALVDHYGIAVTLPSRAPTVEELVARLPPAEPIRYDRASARFTPGHDARASEPSERR